MSFMAAPTPGPASAVSNISVPSYSQTNHIDLTLDDDAVSNTHFQSPRAPKRARTEAFPSPPQPNGGAFNPSHFSVNSSAPHSVVGHSMSPFVSRSPKPMPERPTANTPGSSAFTPYVPPPPALQGQYRPAFAGPSHSVFLTHRQPQTSSSQTSRSPSLVSSSTPTPRPSQSDSSDRQVIDLTGSPSPPPMQPRLPAPNSLPPELPPKTPVCIGQLTVTALVLYPVPYLVASNQGGGEEWAPVRLQYEHNLSKPSGSETIHIKTPSGRSPNGETIVGDAFGVIEQKVATSLGPMLGKGLIRLDAKVRKGPPTLPILPLQMLVYTPKGNIPVVADYLLKCGLLLDHPSPPYDIHRLANYHYHNPHNPPAGGHNRTIFASNRLNYGQRDNSRWTTPGSNGKSVEVQRNQVDEVFKSLKDGDELDETEPSSDVATTLYPHQKKALTFLLEREREKFSPDGKHSSLWQLRRNPLSLQTTWLHVVTQKEVFDQPQEAKGSILADDMGLGKTITCVSLIAATLQSAREFAKMPVAQPPSPPPHEDIPTASHFAGSVWGMPDVSDPGPSSVKAKAKVVRLQDKLEADYARACRIKAKSRATLIICPLSTVSNWEDQFREHWKGEVSVFGGAGGTCIPQASSQSSLQISSQSSSTHVEDKDVKSLRVRDGTPIKVYVYHGNARRPDPAFLADFDAVITTYATLASEFSKQNRSIAIPDDDDDDAGSSDGIGGVDIDEHGNQVMRLPKPKKAGIKRKKSGAVAMNIEVSSALQSIHWFRVVLDEAHCIKETSTVGSRACCDLIADRRLCLTGTPVQNKLDDVFALVKFLRLEPFDDKNVWTEYIGSPVKFGQELGIARLQTIMKCITLRRTKETKAKDGKKILALPLRRDELRYLKFDPQEQEIYNQFFNESKAEFNDLSTKNEVMKNYVGILQKILRLRQICDHFELVDGKHPSQGLSPDGATSYEDIVAAIEREGINAARAYAIFTILRESATTQCVECGGELCWAPPESSQSDAMDLDNAPPPKRGRKAKGTTSLGPTRANSPSSPRPILTRCQHLFCLECYRNSICPGWPNVSPDTRRACSACQTGLGPFDAVEIKSDMASESSKKKPQKREKRQKGGSLEHFHPSTKIKALLSDLIQFSRANPYSVNYDADSIEVQMVDDQGNHLAEGVVKTVVFSQWTSMLDKVEDALEAAGIRYDRLDGTMKRDDRSKAMDALKYDLGCEVLLVSLKAGGVGLNLTAAQRVYLMDPYWNPAVENQAVDRIHRLGQTRPVTTVKLIIENSIEARLLEVQKKKTALANMTLGGQNFSKAEMMQRRLDDLAQLFD